MTIQAIDITDLGIVMAADGAISFDLPIGSRKPEHWRTRKLVQIPYLRAAVGFFGLAEIARKPITQWLEKFIHQNFDVSSLGEFSQRLTDALSMSLVGSRQSHKLGLHLAGYRFSNSGRIPEMHFIRNFNEGHENPERQFRTTEELLGNHFGNLTEDQFLRVLSVKNPIFFQNGYREIYNAFSLPIVAAFQNFVWTNPEFVGTPTTVRDWGLVTEFRLRVVRLVFEKFYATRGHQPVGGRLNFIAIPPDPSAPIEEWSIGGR